MSEVTKQFVFTEIEYGHGVNSKHETTYVTDADSTWMPILMQFAAFLEGCGYVGVYETLEESL